MNQLPNNIHESWHSYLLPLFNDPRMDIIRNTVSKSGYYPLQEQVFRVFEMPLDKIKVVCLGQDVYPKGQGTGLAFAVNEGTKEPASLKIIGNEIIREWDLDQNNFSYESNLDTKWRTLQHWVNQGVFLLNTALTVEPNKSSSHLEIWAWFTIEIVIIISREIKPVWLLWGRKAQAFEWFIVPRLSHIMYIKHNIILGEVDKDINVILRAPHPAAETYPDNKGMDRFTGCNHFNLCNEILRLKGQKPINW